MSAGAIAKGIAAGVGELVQLGLLAAQNAAQAEEVLIKNMKATPSSAEIDDFRDAKDRLGIGDSDPPPTDPTPDVA